MVNDTAKFDSIYVGKQDVGGVTFFNGTIVNSTTGENDFNNPVTFGDDLRFDGKIYRVEEGGDNHLKIADTMIPASDHDLGTSDDRWGNVWAAGANFSETITIQGGTPWTDKNDGAGSGLDADKLDGKGSDYFYKKNGGELTGDIKQSLNKNGAAKALVRVDSAGNCIRSFTFDDSEVECSRISTGTYRIDFDFQVTERYAIVNPNSGPGKTAMLTYSDQRINVFGRDTDGTTASNLPFTLVVY